MLSAAALLLLLQTQAAATVAVTTAPATPWIEQDPSLPGSGQLLNFDLIVTGHPTAPRTLQRVAVSAFDAAGRLMHQRFCDGSGISPCIATLPDRSVAPGGSAIIYNPFPSFPAGLQLAELRYELVYSDSAGVEVDTARIVVHPTRPRNTPALLLPLAGRVLVFDGHDALSHHRRWNLAHPVIRAVGFTGNSGRYAYDLSLVDTAGRMFRGAGDHNADWYSWEAPVRAPALGTVVALANDQPDWEVGHTSLPDSVIMGRPIALYGNYVIIDHGNGAFSLLAHMRMGSVRVKVGDRVTAGQQVGKVGFSGSVYTIHTHYQLQGGPEYSAEGLPSYFIQATRLGSPAPPGMPIRIDSGDLVDAR